MKRNTKSDCVDPGDGTLRRLFCVFGSIFLISIVTNTAGSHGPVIDGAYSHHVGPRRVGDG